jgi:hypothetical protein
MMLTQTSDANVERMLANEMIRDLLSRYCYALDSGDFEAVAGLFVEETGSIEGARLGFRKGREEIAAGFEALAPRNAPMPPRIHMITNTVIQHHAPGSASAESLFVVLHKPQDHVAAAVAGHYEDDVVLVGDSWMFCSRKICAELFGL